MKKVCDGRYELAWEAANSPDRAMVFTTLPIRDRGYLDLAAFPWEAYWVRVDAPFGPVDYLMTHFASSSNNPTCEGDICPPVCPVGIDANECNAREVVAAFNRQRPGAALQIVSGDLNAEPGSSTLAQFEKAGYVDAWLEAGEAECDATTGSGCTGGRDRPENALDGLDVSRRSLQRAHRLRARATGQGLRTRRRRRRSRSPRSRPPSRSAGCTGRATTLA